MARRYVNPNRQAGPAENAFDLAVGARFSIPPGEITNRDRKAYARMLTGTGPAGAKLDKFPWAASWSAFLTAISDKNDEAGARRECRKVMEAARQLQNAAGLAERVPSEGGYLVPERLRTGVLAYMTGGLIRPRCTVVTMDSLRVPVPLLDSPNQSGGTQALGGLTWAMVEETAGITPSVPNFGRVTLEARKAAAYMVGVPNELVADATPFTEDFLPRVIAMGLEWFIDDMAVYTGTGVGEPQALVNAPGAVIVTRNTSSKVLHTDVVTMLKSLHPASKTTAVWLASEDVFDQLLTVYELIGTAPSGQDTSPPNVLKFKDGKWTLFGLEILVNDHQPAVGTQGDLMLCDLSLLLVGERDQMTVEVSSKGTGFPTDTSNIRVRYRWDARFWPQSTITLTNGKVVAPLVVLQ
ncbi:MAG TPA: phage major capsid protein [Streptosporangiaceae bacterium]